MFLLPQQLCSFFQFPKGLSVFSGPSLMDLWSLRCLRLSFCLLASQASQIVQIIAPCQPV